MNGRFVWHDLVTSDLEAAKTFYTALFGWQVNAVDMGGGQTYHTLINAEHQFGGMVPAEAGIPSHWSNYLRVPAGVDAACAKIEAAGGTILQPPFDIPGVGRMAYTVDPQGALINPFQNSGPDVAPVGYYDSTPGGISWLELMCGDPEAAATFYSDLADWTSSVADMGTGPYTLLQDGSAFVAGILALPPGMTQAAWSIYYEITQGTMDETLAEVERLGGTIAMGGMFVPTVGTIAAIIDPTGAMVNLMKSENT